MYQRRMMEEKKAGIEPPKNTGPDAKRKSKSENVEEEKGDRKSNASQKDVYNVQN
jgi:hypothetical protein